MIGAPFCKVLNVRAHPRVVGSRGIPRRTARYTDGPTATLSISDENKNHTNPRITVYTVAGSAHHEELNAPRDSDPQSWKDARKFIVKTISSWL